ncbi:MAG TPA: DUF5666 domain-containing protein [Ktedonobacteraceae bacterium]|nr:DUF5666 domain-containing protein [Ktedonobacteraceae bacterium]
MKQTLLRRLLMGIAVLVLMALFAACAGVGNGGQQTFTGTITAVDSAAHTVTINVNGQSQTITNVPDSIINLLKNQIGKVYSIQVEQNSDGTYSIVTGTNATPEPNSTPETGQTPEPTNGPTEPGQIQFIGTVTSTGNNSIVVRMPDGSSLSMTTNGTDLSDFNNTLPATGTQVKVTAVANTDGSFNAQKIKHTDSGDTQNVNIVEYQGVTTSAVGSDRVIHFTVGNKSFTFTISANADLSDFNNNAQAITNGMTVKVKVQFNGSTPTVLKVSNASNNS